MLKEIRIKASTTDIATIVTVIGMLIYDAGHTRCELLRKIKNTNLFQRIAKGVRIPEGGPTG